MTNVIKRGRPWYRRVSAYCEGCEKIMRTPIVIVLASCLSAGCATTTDNQRTSALECGAGGAAGGFLLCKALGGDNKQCAAVAFLTGAGGAAICYSYAGNLEKRRQELAGKEADLDARLRYVRGVNEDSEKLNRQLRDRVANVTRHTNELVAQVNQKKLSQQNLTKEREALDNEVKVANEQLTLEKKALKDIKQLQAQHARNSHELDAEIAKQQRLLAETQRQTTALASQRQRI